MKNLGRGLVREAAAGSSSAAASPSASRVAPAKMSRGERAFWAQIRGYPGWEHEYFFARPRKFRFDFANPRLKLAVEVDGSAYGGAGRHGYTSTREKENEKINLAASLGWLILRGSTAQAESGWLLEWVKNLCLYGKIREVR